VRTSGWLEEEVAWTVDVGAVLVLDLECAGLDRVEGRASMCVPGPIAGRQQDRLGANGHGPVGEPGEHAFAAERRGHVVVASEEAVSGHAEDDSGGERNTGNERDTHPAIEPSWAARDRSQS